MKRNAVCQRATNMKHCRRLVRVLTDQQQLLCQQLSHSHKSRKRKGTQLKPRSQQIIARAKTDLTLQNCTSWLFGLKFLRLFCALNDRRLKVEVALLRFVAMCSDFAHTYGEKQASKSGQLRKKFPPQLWHVGVVVVLMASTGIHVQVLLFMYVWKWRRQTVMLSSKLV